jgi:hypothetical protein
LIRILNWSGSMAPVHPLPLESGSMPGSGDSAGAAEPQQVEPVSQQELNAWRRGFTPQAEIWNGRLAMLGLSVGLTVLLIARLIPSP